MNVKKSRRETHDRSDMLHMSGGKMTENGVSVHEGSSRSRMEQLALQVLVEDKQEVSRGTLPFAMASITMVRDRDKGLLDSVPMNVFREHGVLSIASFR